MNYWRNRTWLFFYLISLPLVSGGAYGGLRQTIVFSCPIDAHLPLARAIKDLYSQAFHTLGYNFQLLYLPSMRSLSQLQEGKLDGECGRIKELQEDEKLYNIIRVNSKLMTLRLVLMTYDTKLIGFAKEDLFNSKLRIGIQLGAISVDRQIRRADSSLNVHFTHLSHGFNMLKAGRIDLLAGPNLLTLATVNKLQLDPAPQIAVQLGDFDIHPYLTQKRAELAEPLARELERILNSPNNPLSPYSQ